MHSRLDEIRTTQAAALLLKSAPNCHLPRYKKLVRLIYIADREALVRLGYTITRGKHCSLPEGPVVSEVNDMLSNPRYEYAYRSSGYWKRHISCTRRNGVTLVSDPGTGRLGASQIGIVEQVAREHGGKTVWQLGKLTHELPEYDKPTGNRQSNPISVTKTLCSSGRTLEEAKAMVREDAAFSELRYLIEQQ
jgi:hypothetical protein